MSYSAVMDRYDDLWRRKGGHPISPALAGGSGPHETGRFFNAEIDVSNGSVFGSTRSKAGGIHRIETQFFGGGEMNIVETMGTGSM